VPHSRLIDGPLSVIRVDFRPRHRQPTASRLALATVVAIAGSLIADALIVVMAKSVFPSTRGFVHFQFSDYAKLTVIGVLIACLGWPIITRVSSAPRWIYARLAVIVTLILLLPDVWLLHQHQPSKAVAALMVMHLAIALITYWAVVLLAPVGPAS
jgi:hypothetical protein